MKQIFKRFAPLCATILGLLVLLAGCADIFSPNQPSPKKGAAGGLQITVNSENARLRSIYPTFTFTKYELTFVGPEGHHHDPVVVAAGTPTTVQLADGDWEITATGFVTIGDTEHPAAEQTKTVTVEKNTNQVLSFVISPRPSHETDKGIISYDISFTGLSIRGAGLHVYPILGSWAHPTVSIDLVDAPDGKFDFDPGYHMMTVEFETMDGRKVTWTEVIYVHSYAVTAIVKEFTAADLAGIINLSGPAVISINDETPDEAHVSAYTVAGDFLVGIGVVDVEAGEWSMTIQKLFDAPTALYFIVQGEAEHSGSFHKTIVPVPPVMVSDSDVDGIDLGWTETVAVIELSGVVNMTINGAALDEGELYAYVEDEDGEEVEVGHVQLVLDADEWTFHMNMHAFTAPTTVLFYVTGMSVDNAAFEDVLIGEIPNVFDIDISGIILTLDLTTIYEIDLVFDAERGTITVEATETDDPLVWKATMETFVEFTVAANPGFAIDEITVTTGDDTEVHLTPVRELAHEAVYVFEMPAENVTITATFTIVVYDIEVVAVGGTVTVTDGLTEAAAGKVIAFTVAASPDYAFEDVRVYYKEHDEGVDIEIDVEDLAEEDGVYTFTMPAADVYIEATFVSTLGIPALVTVSAAGEVTSVQKGTTLQFHAAAVYASDHSTSVPEATFTWSLDGTYAAGTSINASGFLTVALGETAGNITVVATLTTEGFSGHGQEILEVTSPGDIAVHVTVSAAEGALEVEWGKTLQFHAAAIVIATDLPVTNATFTWLLDGEEDVDYVAGTSIDATGLLTVAANETATELKVRATIANVGYSGHGEFDVEVVSPGAVIVEVTVNVSAASDQVVKGGSLQFTAEIEEAAPAYPAFIWTLEGSYDAETAIGTNGVLHVAATEMADFIVVRATIDNVGYGGHGEKTVIVTTPGDIPVTVTVTADGNATEVEPGDHLQFNASVASVPSATFAWILMGEYVAGTQINETTGLLIVAADEIATTITVRATITTTGYSGYGDLAVNVTGAGGEEGITATVTFAGFGKEDVVLDDDNLPVTIRLYTADKIIVTVTGTWTTYVWRMDGIPIAGATGATYTVTSDYFETANEITVGQHKLTVIVGKDGKFESKELTFTVVVGDE